MLSKRADNIWQIVGVLIIGTFIFLGAEVLLLQKFNAFSDRDAYSRVLNQCQANLAKAQRKIDTLISTKVE